jgi:predicted DNA-binding transcriptional regulator AlpA
MPRELLKSGAARDIEGLLSPVRVSELLDVPVATLYRWSYLGTGPPTLKVGKHLRYVPSELQAWLDEQAKA